MVRTAKLTRGTGGAVHIPDDNYDVTVEDVKQDRAKGSGKPVIFASIRVTTGKYKGTKIPHSWSLQEQAMWRLTEDMLALGVLNEEEQELLDAGELDIGYREIVEHLEGAEGRVSVFTDTYQGSKRSKINGFVVEEDESSDDEDSDDDDSDSGDDDEEEEEPEEPVVKRKGR